ncbi:MAG: TatD family hydrolase [Candidatus Protochlamydia sp.]|nr:TatD family hydrolase [Candidatus Protochlamydia sp.]
MNGSASFFDSHAHLTSNTLNEQVNAILERARLASIHAVINICTDILTLERGLKLSEKYPWVYQAAATTPHDVEKEGEAVFETIAACARSGSLIAVGETGLDYHYEYSAKQIQQEFLRRYLHLALECRLPVIIHCREAFADFFDILDAEYQVEQKHAPGVLHCFTGTMAEAEEVIKRGWMLSLSGIVTFKKSIELQQVAKEMPLSQLLIETDAPYLAPLKKRGKTNEPAYVVEVAACIAALKNLSIEEVAQATSDNARRLFGL